MKSVAVGEISEQIRGVSYGKGDATSAPADGYAPVLRAGNITEFGVTFEDLVYVPKRFVSEKQLLRSGDVLIAASSGSLDVVGKAAPVLHDYEGVFGAFCKVLRPRKSHIEPSYFAHYFKTVEYRRKVSSLAAGANINNLKNEHLDELLIPLPPLQEQRRIAAILDKADALRAKRREALAQLDRLAQSIFVEMFGDPSDNPQCWIKKPLSELIAEDESINYGVVQPGDDVADGVPLIRVGDLIDGQVRHESLKRIAPEIERSYQRSRLKGDEILVSCVGSVGVVALASISERGFNIARAVARIRVGDGMDRDFLATQLQTSAIQRYFTQELRTVSQPTLNIKQISETQLICPPLAMQRLFADRLDAVRKTRKRLISSSDLNESMFHSLQYRAFRGEL